jgi:hypothetical protein
MHRWPREVQQAKVIQQAVGRVSKLTAIGRILHPLAGLEPELPTPADERASIVSAMTQPPDRRPANGEARSRSTSAITSNPAEIG